MLATAVRGLPADRLDWGDAMLAELDGVRGGRARWSFALGCVRAAIVLQTRAAIGARGRGGWSVRGAVLGLVAAALALALYGLFRYPQLRSDRGTWAAAAFLLLVLLAYAALALALSRGTTPHAVAGRRNGLLGGFAVGVAWIVVLAPTPFVKAWVAVPLAAALLVPAGVAVRTGRTGPGARPATTAALWSGLVGGLAAFVIWVTATYLRDGRPYDRQLVRDFHRSGAHDLATYAVSDNLGAAIGLLVIVPLVALALGSLGALATERSGG